MLRSTWFKILLFVWLTACTIVGLVPPIAGTIADVAMMHQMSAGRAIVAKVFPLAKEGAAVDPVTHRFEFQGRDASGSTAVVVLPEKPQDFDRAENYLIDVTYDPDRHALIGSRVVQTDVGLTLPFIAGLEERARIIFFHVPMAWLSVLAFLVSMMFAIRYLRTRDLDLDMKSAIAAGLGLLFTILATVTGSIWAKFNWGSFWNWDPRETSIFVLLLVYGAYFALRSAIDIHEKRAALSAVYSILAFVTVPFFIFIMPRIMPGLHPGSSDDTSAGPVVSSGGLNATMRVILYSTLLGFIGLSAWLMNLKIRLNHLITASERD